MGVVEIISTFSTIEGNICFFGDHYVKLGKGYTDSITDWEKTKEGQEKVSRDKEQGG